MCWRLMPATCWLIARCRCCTWQRAAPSTRSRISRRLPIRTRRRATRPGLRSPTITSRPTGTATRMKVLEGLRRSKDDAVRCADPDGSPTFIEAGAAEGHRAIDEVLAQDPNNVPALLLKAGFQTTRGQTG